MKSFLAMTSTLALFLTANSAQAQFNFGKVIKGEARQMFRKIENDVRQKVRKEIPKFREIPKFKEIPKLKDIPKFTEKIKKLPFKPPVVTLPFKPPVVTLPFDPPVKTLPYDPPRLIIKPKCPPVCPPIVHPVEPDPDPIHDPEPELQPELQEVELGSVLSIDGEGFGEEAGGVFVKIESLVLAAELVSWSNELAEAKLPRLPILEAAKATIFVLDAGENVAEQMDVMVTPPTAEPEPEEKPEPAPMVQAGQEVTLEGQLGEKQGRVELRIGALKLQASITEWKTTETTLKIPEIDTNEVHSATIAVYAADGKVVEEIEVQYSGKSE